jgi:L-ascorbate metabolism protein UlaG (beta-lactamase superfamily)
MSFKMRWFGTACFEIVLPNSNHLVTDPFITDAVNVPYTWEKIEDCQYIFITHGHFDHVLDVAPLVKRFEPRIFCSQPTAEALIKHQGIPSELVSEIQVGDTVEEMGLTVEVIRGKHVDFAQAGRRLAAQAREAAEAESEDNEALMARVFAGAKRPAKLNEWMEMYPPGPQLNFIFDLEGGMRVYLLGSYPDPDLTELAKSAAAHIILQQVMFGRLLKGLEEQTLELAKASGASIMVPQHHDPLMEGFPLTDLSELKRIFKERSQITFQEFEYARWYEFE